MESIQIRGTVIYTKAGLERIRALIEIAKATQTTQKPEVAGRKERIICLIPRAHHSLMTPRAQALRSFQKMAFEWFYPAEVCPLICSKIVVELDGGFAD